MPSPPPDITPSPAIAVQPAGLGKRLLALLYDLFPAFGLWFVIAALFTAMHGDAVRGGWLGAIEFAVLWLVTGLYATLSWRYGGQTLGLRAWHLRVVSADESRSRWSQLWLRYALGGASLLLLGAGFWWAWFDPDRRTWHDRASGTRLLRSG